MGKKTIYCKAWNYKWNHCEIERYINLKNTDKIKNTDKMKNTDKTKNAKLAAINSGIRQRAFQLRREHINTLMPVLFTIFATVCMILICAMSYCSIRTCANSGFKYYTSVTVEYGETLWDIADEFVDYDHYKNKNSYITEVQKINHLDENCSINAGQILILPYYSGQYIK